MGSMKIGDETITVIIDDGVTLKDVGRLPGILIEMLRKIGKWNNPDFFRNKAMNISNYKTPEHILARAMYADKNDSTKRDLRYERGLWPAIRDAVIEYNKIACDRKKGADMPSVGLLVSNQLVEMPVEFPKFKLTLENYQEVSRAKVLDAMTPSQGIISYPPGGGKTITAASIMAARGQRTLVVCHTTALVNQWYEVMSGRCFDGLSISKVGAKKKDFSGKHVVIATVQTMNKLLEFPEGLEEFQKFGMIILDECHHVSAPTFMGVIGKSKAKYRYGLSASLKRRDNKQFLMNAAFGSLLVSLGYNDVTSRLSLPSVVPVVFNSEECPLNKVYQIRKGEEFLDYMTLYKWQVGNAARQEVITNIIKECISSQDNYTLVLTKLRVHAEALYALFKDVVPSGLLVGGGDASYQKEKDRILEEANKGRIRLIFGTSIADEGLDIARLNRLVLTTPTSFDEILRQRIGRIARALPGKSAPIVYDIIDAYLPELIDSWEKRKKFYRSLDIEIKTSENDEE